MEWKKKAAGLALIVGTGLVLGAVAANTTACDGSNCYSEGMGDCLDGWAYGPTGDSVCQADYDEGWVDGGCSSDTYDTGWW